MQLPGIGRLVMQLVVQLHRQASRALCGARHAGNDEQCTVALQDFAVLSAFARDVATALRALASRPFRLTAFVLLSRLCKERETVCRMQRQERRPQALRTMQPRLRKASHWNSQTDALPQQLFGSADWPGMQGPSARCLRFIALSLSITTDCDWGCPLAHPTAPLRQGLQTSLIRLMAAVSRWAVEGTMEVAEAEKVLRESLEAFGALQELHRGVPPLQIQAELGAGLPTLLRFVARLGTSLGPSLAKLLEFTLAEHSAALLLPRLPSLTACLLLATEKGSWSLRPLACAVRRFGEAPMRCPPGFDAAWLQAALADADACGPLAELVPALCGASVISSSGTLASALKAGPWSATSPFAEALLAKAELQEKPRILAELLSKNAGVANPQSWRLLLRALDTFGEVELLQELLTSPGYGAPAQRAALWLALARALRRRLEHRPEPQSEAAWQRYLCKLLRVMDEEASSCASTQWASLASALTALIAASLLAGEEGGEEVDRAQQKKLLCCRANAGSGVLTRKRMEIRSVLPPCCLRSLAALPSPLESAPNFLRRRPVFGRTSRTRRAVQVGHCAIAAVASVLDFLDVILTGALPENLDQLRHSDFDFCPLPALQHRNAAWRQHLRTFRAR
ncbi:unnamed protein product [Symbiodinium natans]|uniref:Uncharacterized protein n=1 Tax=Symbiodinium natans TaxID=878477 RepID=A0A812UB83_9DINO|nr:unnamed protein product [Symbiodinium natans]